MLRLSMRYMLFVGVALGYGLSVHVAAGAIGDLPYGAGTATFWIIAAVVAFVVMWRSWPGPHHIKRRPLIRKAGTFWNWVFRRAGNIDAIALPWGVIYIEKERRDDLVLALHEMVHLGQMARDGTLAFTIAYFQQLRRYGYWDAPYEVEARQVSIGAAKWIIRDGCDVTDDRRLLLDVERYMGFLGDEAHATW